MKPFMDDDFLLDSETAIQLFSFAKDLPIVDYHCHLSAKEIYDDKQFSSIGSLWLDHDHYKWRVMRAHGVSENFVTGEASPYEKFYAFAGSLPYAIGNPVYHWSMLELQRYFDIYEPLSEANAQKVWTLANSIIAERAYSPRSMIELSKVTMLCTTEDPCADLSYHALLKNEFVSCSVLPAFRPDRFLAIQKAEPYSVALEELGNLTGANICTYGHLKEALEKRIDFFDKSGCIASDHDINLLVFDPISDSLMTAIMQKSLTGASLTFKEVHQYRSTLLLYLAQSYAKRDWAMEMHIGCNRDQNMKMVRSVGEACGYDSVGDYSIACDLGLFFNALEEEGKLPKTILFSLNPKDNWVLAALANTYQSSEVASKMQLGAAWWMQDHKYGMEQQLLALANTGVLGHFIGMLTDSRSFLSYPRHEYFRRILCNFIGQYVEKGEYPNDIEVLKVLVEDICYKNVVVYFQKRRGVGLLDS
ncbi:glucuronate isomerase [Sphaerochaeta sp. PS]|uniref:glucuronate isomerase n=1 Tax=Sphaerochaeta sp. PS TaxID=3076336 RepID=UPI0028A4AE64|nr:glucuronate isomerase [Sphaerochaeta sp. PS]MDT4763200.1 glucuronate isomerase [Sphaerochaeta sp. PS]